MGHPSQLKFQPYYCEENAWRLCGHPFFGTTERIIMFISNPARAVAFAGQRAAPRGQWVLWDYHVVFLAKEQSWFVWDPDARAGLKTGLMEWLDHSFPDPDLMPVGHRPWFRVVDGDTFMANFKSDRSHMRNLHGEWLQPPPDWPPPAQSTNLMKFATIPGDFLGQVLSLKDLKARFCAPPRIEGS